LWACLLVAFASNGCQLPQAQPEATSPGPGDCSRGVVLARQLVADTAVQTVVQPLDTGAMVAYNTAATVQRFARELVCRRLLVPLAGPPGPLAPAFSRECLHPVNLEFDLNKACGKHLRPALLHLYLDGEDALVTLQDLIDQARRRIDVLVYQWDSDALGWSLAQRLAARAACLGEGQGQAVDGGANTVVRVLVDGGGNLIHGEPEYRTAAAANDALGWLAAQPHVEVLRTRNGLAHFDHRKLVVLDGATAWTGGRNFTLASFFEYHDVSYTLRGPLVRDMADRFETAWHQAGGHTNPKRQRGHTSPKRQRGEGEDEAASGTDTASCGSNAWARVVGTGRGERGLAAAVYKAVDHAWHHVYLENPYFTDTQLWCKLVRARRRGADVRVVLAMDSQSKVIDRALRVTTNRLLKSGIRVYYYPGMTHVKAASVDSRWAYVGTGNFDSLSFRRNCEVGLAVGAGAVIAELEQSLFLADFRPEWEVTAPLPVNLGDYACEMLATLVL
jgi:cardiolipin synthase